MIKEIPTCGPLNARIRVPGSKSLTNRALVCAALAQGESVIAHASDSDDSHLLANGLNQLGVLVRSVGPDLRVQGTGGILQAPKFPIHVRNAGTTLRFFLSLSALAKGRVVMEGSERMAERPHDDLLVALRSLGVDAVQRESTAHFEVQGGTLQGGTVSVKGEKSSQFLSSLLLIAPYAKGRMTITVDGPLSSRSYVVMTLDVMKSFGVDAGGDGLHQFILEGRTQYIPANYLVEADASSASYPMAAAAIAGGTVFVEEAREDSRTQGDAGFARVLREMGCTVTQEPGGLRVHREGQLHGVDVDMNTMPDVVPTLAAVALFAKGPTRIRNVAHLRFKESDRLDALAAGLNSLGGDVRVAEDGLEIVPVPLHGGQLDPYDDHRLAMTFALVGLRVPGVRVENPECVKKSYPTFWSEFEKFSEAYGR